MDQKKPASLKRPTVVLCLTFIAVYAFLIRCVHLLNPDHYYIISPDSYFFHWMAELVQSGERVDYPFIGHAVPTIWHTGITYPLAYIAKAVSFVFGMSPVDALNFTSKFLPPTLTVISIMVIYLAVSRIYNQRVALFSAFTWATLFQAVWIHGAGYLDRDGLSMLLIMMGAFIFYLSRGWHWRIGNLDLGWVVGTVAVIAIEALLLLEWVWVGPVLLLIILTAFFVAEVLAKFFRRIARSLMEADLMTLGRQSPASIVAAIRESNWRPFVPIIGLSALMGGISPGVLYMYRLATWAVREALFPTNAGVPVAEMQGIGWDSLLGYWVLIIPLVVGLYITLINHRRADLFCLSWFACLFFIGLLAARVFLYTAPAACIISGLGLAFIWDLEKLRLLHRYIEKSVLRYIKIGSTVLLLFLLFLSSSLFAYWAYPDPRVAANNNWQDALIYLRDNTSEEAVIMSWWDYGYWILDLGERRPVVDGGFYAYDQERLRDVGLAYCTTEPSEAAEIMEKYEADYLVFSRIEEVIMATITRLAEQELTDDSLYNRALSGDFRSDQGLKVVYRNEEVVILGLE